MKTILLVLAAVLVIVSCKKEPTSLSLSGQGKLYGVRLQVSAFRQQIENMSRRGGSVLSPLAQADEHPLGDYVDNLYFLVYDSEGALVKRILQTSDNADFGTFEDSLGTGSYSLVVMGYRAFGATVGNVDSLPLNEASLNFSAPGGYLTPETYFKKVALTVQQEDIDQEVQLERIVGKLQLDLSDQANLYVASGDRRINVAVRVRQESRSFLLNSEQPGPLNQDSIVYRPELDDMFVLNTDKPFSVVVSYSDQQGNILNQKTIDSVRCYKNRVTHLRGHLFTPDNPNSGFTVSVDDDWGTDSTEVNF